MISTMLFPSRFFTRAVASALAAAWLCAAPTSSAHAQDAQHAGPRHAIAMHGEPKYGPDFAHFDYVNPHAPKGGQVRFGAVGSFDNLNPFIIKGETVSGTGNIYDSLMTSSADEAFTEYGLLAESVEMPDDRSSITFHLRAEARWHDGQPITADDVIWTFNTLVEKGVPFYRFYYAGVAKVEKLDKRSIKFTFKPGDNRELPLIVGQMAVLPKHYWEQEIAAGRAFDKTTLKPPLGSGPYKIGAFEPGRYIEYVRVDDYWGKDLPVNVGHNNYAAVRYEYFRDANVTVEAFKGGAIDMRVENISKVWATAYDIPEVTNGQIKKEELPHQRTAPIQGYIYNLRRDLFADDRVRQALAYAFDFEWSNRNLFYGQYARTRSYFGNSELEAKGLPTGRELEILESYRGRIPDAVFTTEYNPPATQGDGRIRSNLREADRLLKEAGWVIEGRDRVNQATGQKFEFEILLSSPAFERVTLPFAKNLERLGITARVRTVDSAQYIKRLETFDYDMIVLALGQSLSPGNEQLNYWGSAAADLDGSSNYIGIKNDVIDELIQMMIAASDRKELVARVRALDRVLQWGHYLIPHWFSDVDRIIYWNKFSRPDAIPMQGAQTNTWWVDPAKEAELNAARGKDQ